MRPRLLVFAVAGATMGALGCAGGGGGGDPDLEAARDFNRHPLYWVGERFEKWDVEHVEAGAREFVPFIYGTCEPGGGIEGGCPPPLQIQIQPLCAHIEAVARAPAWKRRQGRGA